MMIEPRPGESLTRSRILRSMQEILSKKKVSGTRMRDIAKGAGISMGTLHYHFRTKTALLLEVLDNMEVFFENRQVQLFLSETSPSDKIKLFSNQQKQLLRDHPEIEEIFLDFWGHGMIDEVIREKTQIMYEAWRRDIRLAIQQGIQTGEFNPEQTAIAPYLFTALLEGIALQYLPNKKTYNLDLALDSVHHLIILWLSGQSNQPSQDPSNPLIGIYRKSYPSDLTDRQWDLIEPYICPARTGGRPRSTDMREVVNAMAYITTCRCPWRMLPHDYPGWQTVYAYYRSWKKDGTLEKIDSALEMDFSQEEGEL